MIGTVFKEPYVQRAETGVSRYVTYEETHPWDILTTVWCIYTN